MKKTVIRNSSDPNNPWSRTVTNIEQTNGPFGSTSRTWGWYEDRNGRRQFDSKWPNRGRNNYLGSPPSGAPSTRRGNNYQNAGYGGVKQLPYDYLSDSYYSGRNSYPSYPEYEESGQQSYDYYPERVSYTYSNNP